MLCDAKKLCPCVCLFLFLSLSLSPSLRFEANSHLAQGTRCAKEVCLLHLWRYRGSRPRVRPFRETGGDKGLPEVVPRIFDEEFVLKEEENGDCDCDDYDDYDKRSHNQPLT